MQPALSDIITLMCNNAGHSTVILFSLIRDFKITCVCFNWHNENRLKARLCSLHIVKRAWFNWRYNLEWWTVLDGGGWWWTVNSMTDLLIVCANIYFLLTYLLYDVIGGVDVVTGVSRWCIYWQQLSFFFCFCWIISKLPLYWDITPMTRCRGSELRQAIKMSKESLSTIVILSVFHCGIVPRKNLLVVIVLNL